MPHLLRREHTSSEKGSKMPRWDQPFHPPEPSRLWPRLHGRSQEVRPEEQCCFSSHRASLQAGNPSLQASVFAPDSCEGNLSRWGRLRRARVSAIFCPCGSGNFPRPNHQKGHEHNSSQPQRNMPKKATSPSWWLGLQSYTQLPDLEGGSSAAWMDQKASC